MSMTGSVRLDDTFWVWCGRANQDSLQVVRKFFAEEGETRSLELLKWQYLERLGGSYVSIAHTSEGVEDGAASLYAALPSLVQWGEEVVSSVQSFDSITSKRFRGKGVFSRLGNFTYRRFQDEGVRFVYGIPNESINNARITQLGWQSLDPLPFMVRPIGLRYLRVRTRIRRPSIVARSVSNELGRIRKVGICPPDVTGLLHRSELAGRIGVRRDHQYLAWRLARPGSSYSHYECRSSSGELIGYAVYELVLKHGCATGYLMELISDVRHPAAIDELADAVLLDMKSRGADIALAWWMESSGTARALRRHGFISLPERFRPIHLHLGYRFLGDGHILKRDEFSFSYLDSDTV